MAIEAAPIDSEQVQHKSAGAPPRWRRPAFWSAIAGMAVALMIGCLVVAIEMASTFGHRSSHSRARAAQLQARVNQLQSRLTSANLALADLRRNEQAMLEFNRIINAPDGRLIRLQHKEGASEVQGAASYSPIRASAVIELSGLPARSTAMIEARWLVRQGESVLAAQLPPAADRSGLVAISLQSPPTNAIALVVIASGGMQQSEPKSIVLLRGELSSAGHR